MKERKVSNESEISIGISGLTPVIIQAPNEAIPYFDMEGNEEIKKEIARKMNEVFDYCDSVFWEDLPWNKKREQFLKSYSTSPSTYKAYELGIKQYEKYCDMNGIPYGNSDNDKVRDYKDYLIEQNLSNNSIRLYLTSISLFFDFCIETRKARRMINNPFVQKRLLPKTKVFKRDKIDITGKQVKDIFSWFQSNSSELLIMTLKYHIRYGTRIGSFSGITEIKGNEAHFVTKGKRCLNPIVIDKSDLKQFKLFVNEWKDIGSYNLNVQLNRKLKKCCLELNIPVVTSHRFRAFFKQELDRENTSTKEIAFRMNHRDIHSQDSYGTDYRKDKTVYKGLNVV